MAQRGAGKRRNDIVTPTVWATPGKLPLLRPPASGGWFSSGAPPSAPMAGERVPAKVVCDGDNTACFAKA